MSFSEFTVQDYEIIAREYADLKELARKRCADEKELSVVQKAFEFANEAHKNVRRRSGEPYMLHPIAVAKIVVSDIGLGYKSIAAALLHDVVEDTEYTTEDIRKLFGDRIALLVDGLTKIKTVLDNQDHSGRKAESTSLQAENFKRILLTLNDDVRVILIKLADRLHNCRTIEYMPEYKREKILSETMYIFVPLAHRLGLYEIKSEMENIWLRFKEPQAYNDICTKVALKQSDKAREIDQFIEPIEKALKEAGFSFEIKKRLKTPYSIWHKMQTKGIDFDQVYDLYAVRVIFTPSTEKGESERDQCYHIFSIITGIYRYKPDRVRDWVKHPKSNGYEALHCTLMSGNGIWIEVQIRTRRMDDIAEKGIAAHWAYKKDGYASENDSQMDKWLDKVKEILVNPDVSALELLDMIHNDLTTSNIFVFTPKGEQKSVPNGSTALDFAYMIHSEIGDKAIAAKVNMKLVPLSQTLKTGDMVEIITADGENPKKQWFSFLRTRHARNLVMDYFRKDKASEVSKGKKALQDEVAKAGAQWSDALVREMVNAVDAGSAEELFFRYSLGIVNFAMIKEEVDFEQFRPKPSPSSSSKGFFGWFKKSSDSTKEPQSKTLPAPAGKRDRTDYIINSPGDDQKFVIATCCRPIDGDQVIGFLSPDGVVTVHKKTCPIAENLASKHGDWIVLPRWSGDDEQSFLVRLTLKGIDRVGLLNEITRYISLVMGVNMRRLSLGTEQGIFSGYIDLFVKDKDVLDELIEHLSSVDGIQQVQRADINPMTEI